MKNHIGWVAPYNPLFITFGLFVTASLAGRGVAVSRPKKNENKGVVGRVGFVNPTSVAVILENSWVAKDQPELRKGQVGWVAFSQPGIYNCEMPDPGFVGQLFASPSQNWEGVRGRANLFRLRAPYDGAWQSPVNSL